MGVHTATEREKLDHLMQINSTLSDTSWNKPYDSINTY